MLDLHLHYVIRSHEISADKYIPNSLNIIKDRSYHMLDKKITFLISYAIGSFRCITDEKSCSTVLNIILCLCLIYTHKNWNKHLQFP